METTLDRRVFMRLLGPGSNDPRGARDDIDQGAGVVDRGRQEPDVISERTDAPNLGSWSRDRVPFIVMEDRKHSPYKLPLLQS